MTREVSENILDFELLSCRRINVIDFATDTAKLRNETRLFKVPSLEQAQHAAFVLDDLDLPEPVPKRAVTLASDDRSS